VNLKWIIVKQNVAHTELQHVTNLTEIRNQGKFFNVVSCNSESEMAKIQPVAGSYTNDVRNTISLSPHKLSFRDPLKEHLTKY